jgi:hypothetical protein
MAATKTDHLDRMIATPMDQLRFEDFIKLKSGRDKLSNIKLDILKSTVSATDSELVATTFADDQTRQAACFRWILRGLTSDKAIRKIKTDIEITQNVRNSKRAPEFDKRPVKKWQAVEGGGGDAPF